MRFRARSRPDFCWGSPEIGLPAGRRPAEGAVFVLHRQKSGRNAARKRINLPPELQISSEHISVNAGDLYRLLTFRGAEDLFRGMPSGYLKAVWRDFLFAAIWP